MNNQKILTKTMTQYDNPKLLEVDFVSILFLLANSALSLFLASAVERRFIPIFCVTPALMLRNPDLGL